MDSLRKVSYPMRDLRRVIVIGGVAGGMSAAARLRRLNAEVEIVVIERSHHVSYANCGLPYYVGGVIKDESQLILQTPESLFKRFRLDVRVDSEVLRIDRLNQVVDIRNSASGQEYSLSYDAIILSPGASPTRLPIPGIENALTLRNVEDVLRMSDATAQHKKAIILGAGFIGLEMAENLVHRGLDVTIVEIADQVLTPIDPEMATFVEQELLSHGVKLLLKTSVTEITEKSVQLNDGNTLEADMVISAVGVRPDISLAKNCGLTIGVRGGIQTNEFNQTDDPRIYAIGDAAEKRDSQSGEAQLVPLANIANRHGRIVADHLAGKPIRHVDAQSTAIVKVFDLTVAISGWSEKRLKAAGREFLAVHSHPSSHAGYYPGGHGMALKILVDPHTEKIMGVQGVGKDGVDKRIDVIATAMRGGISAPELADLELAYAPPFGSAKDPVNMLGYISENALSGITPTAQWHEVESLQEKGWTILDVRSSGEVSAGSIPGSVNISVDELREKMELIPEGKLLVTCRVGQRGHIATRLLREWGREAINLDGGYLTWINSPAGKKQPIHSA